MQVHEIGNRLLKVGKVR